MTSDRERARLVLNALRSLPPGTLDTAVAHAQGPDGDRLAAVRDAMRSADPETALAEVLRDISPDELSAARGLAEASAFAARASSEAQSASTALSFAMLAQQDLAAELENHRAQMAAEDPTLTSVLDETLAYLGNDEPFRAVKDALATLETSQRILENVRRGADPRALAVNLTELRQRRAELATLAAPDSRLRSVIDAARSYAVERGDNEALARLAVVAAAVADSPNEALACWHEVFDRALAASLLPLSKVSAERIQLTAASKGDFETILEVSSRLADLADELADNEVALAANADQALALARLGRPDLARVAVERVHDHAGDDGLRVAKANLVEAQVLELMGDTAGARALFREIMEYSIEVEGAAHIVGWAALHLGRLEIEKGHMFRARQDLELAQRIGDAAGDHVLLVLAASARVEAAPDRGVAEAILRSRVPEAAREELQRVFERRWR